MRILLLIFLLLLPVSSFAANFYVDPVSGSDLNNGSSDAPWKKLQRLFDEGLIESREWDGLPYTDTSKLVLKNSGAPIKGGDTIYLRSGSYGELEIIQFYNTSQILIAAEEGHTPLFRNILIRSSKNWTFIGLSVNPSSYASDNFSNLISLESHNFTGPIDSIIVKNCSVMSAYNSNGWSRSDWNSKARNGIRVDGTQMKIINNSFTNVNFGISVGATHSLIERNKVTNFAGDGMRGLGDHTVFQYNTIKNCYDVNDNHDDGFQSWSRGSDGKVGTGSVKGIVLRGNTIINYEDPDQPHRGTLQGIGCFDGMFDDWVVEKNWVQVDHWHGISLYGARNTIIRENIVTDPNKERPGQPWIMLNNHKNGTPPRDSQVTCNVAPKIIVSDGANMVVENNTLSETGGPRPSGCPVHGQAGVILPLLLDEDK